VSTTNSLDLYSLLPAIYRIRDAERGYPLRAFLGLVSGQAQLLKADIDGLWDDLFIETCAEWIIPYIGDLVANNPLPEGVVRRRADVARTIYYRRRKGTLTMLEQMARDVTGWDAHAVAFFEQLGWTQNLNHLRFRMDNSTDAFDPYASDRVGTALLRDMDAMDRLDGAFDTTTHTVDVRPPCQLKGWYNIRNIGFFLWRLQSFFMREVTPRKSSAYADGFYFSPIGNPAPLFTHPAPPPLGSQFVTETEVQSPIRKVAFYFHPENYYLQPDIFYTDHPAASKSIAIYHGTQAITANLIPATPAIKIVCGDLSNWTPPASGEVAIDVALGRLAFAPGEAPADGVVVTSAYGLSGTLGGGPYDRRSIVPTSGDPGPAIPGTVADPLSLGALIRVPSPGINTITSAIAAWNPAVTPRAVIQIDDNRTYQENLAIAFPAVPPPPGAPSPELVIQAGNLLRPTLIGNVTVTGGTGAEELVLNGLLMAGQLHLQGNLGLVEIVQSTLVPGLALDEQGQPTQPDAPSVLADPPADALELLIDHSITGALRLPEEMPGLFVRDSIIDSPAAESVADFVPVLISGSLSAFPAISSPNPTVNVTIGDQGPYSAVFTSPTVPTSLTDARDSLQAAIRAAHPTIPFTAARVLSANKRLIVLPGSDEQVVIESADSDPTAAELRLDPPSARQTWAVVGGPLPAAFTLTSGALALSIAVGTDVPQIASLLGAPGTPAQARDSLQAAIRAAGATPGYTGAVVTNLDTQLVAISGDGAAPIVFGAAAADSATIVQLQLTSRRFAIAADAAGNAPGPPTTLMRTTIFGEVHVQQLPLASEVIFTAVVQSQRRQNGCVRFSFVPEGSGTPRRYRCQPDFEILQRIQQAEQDAALLGLTLSFADQDAIRDDVRSWLKPSFTDFHYGLPAYGQLSPSCPEQIQTGAANESEMGAFCFLQQPQRAASLRVRLTEYLPFGLQPGLIYVT
jgi:hypothetical protein